MKMINLLSANNVKNNSNYQSHLLEIRLAVTIQFLNTVTNVNHPLINVINALQVIFMLMGIFVKKT